MTVTEADQRVHAVETQWHYPILTGAGFVAETESATGFVRSYCYRHPSGTSVVCTTGTSADYWRASTGDRGYWSELKEWAKKVAA